MMWLLGGAYCLVIWLVFAKWRLLRLSLPIALLLASIGPLLIVSWLFCAQYYHPYSNSAIAFDRTILIVPQISKRVPVTSINVKPNTLIKKGETLFELDRAPLQADADNAAAAVNEARAQVDVSEAAVVTAQATVKRARADLAYYTNKRKRDADLVKTNVVSQEEFEQTLATYQQAASGLDEALAAERQAKLGVDLANTRLREAEVNLKDAQYDLEQTTVIAPTDGYVTNQQLRVGSPAGGLGFRPVMTFIESQPEEDRVVVATFGQKNFLLIEPGQYAEVILKGYPGRVFHGEVLETIEIVGQGQLLPGGDLPEQIASGLPARFAVKIKLNDTAGLRVPGGSRGQAAVYTDNVQVAGIPIMFVLRANGWLNYLL
ncbi:Inner membrane protein YiaV precursor [Planctomycetes bacterium MalM25]|nr:Inner membrane protein YiaV precursor [Planctomycetes bacterium MalM25]